MSKAMNFLTWLIEDTHAVTAEADSPRDAQLKQYADEGYLKLTLCTRHDNTYAITSKWMQEIRR